MTPEELAEIEAHPKGLPIPFLNVERLVAEVRRLRDERDEATAAERREHAAMILRDYRGVETPCPDCAGWGVQAYASTATWRGGVGGQAITTGVCDRCWGSGDATKPGANLRALEAELRRLREERDENFEDVARIRDFAAAEARKADERIGRAEAEVARLREALDAAQRIVKRKADREAGREET